MTPTTIFLADPATLRVSTPYSETSRAALNGIGGSHFDGASKTWRVPLAKLDALLAAFGDTAAVAPEVLLAAPSSTVALDELPEPRKPATPEERTRHFAETCAWAGVTLRIEGRRVLGSGGCWTPVLQAEIDKRAAALVALLQGGWQPAKPIAAPVAPVPTSYDRITAFDRGAAKWEAGWLATEARKQDMIAAAQRRKRKEVFSKIDKQLGLEELLR